MVSAELSSSSGFVALGVALTLPVPAAACGRPSTQEASPLCFYLDTNFAPVLLAFLYPLYPTAEVFRTNT